MKIRNCLLIDWKNFRVDRRVQGREKVVEGLPRAEKRASNDLVTGRRMEVQTEKWDGGTKDSLFVSGIFPQNPGRKSVTLSSQMSSL